MVAAALWRATSDLLLGGHRRWTGTGKCLLREMMSFDIDNHTDYAARLLDGVRSAAAVDPEPMRLAVGAILQNR